jgi:DUF971 family protein
MACEDSWPTEIRISPDRRMLTVAFDDGMTGTVSAELLRVRSPSAEVQGHSPSERKTVPGKRHVAIIGAEPVGNYAIRLKFDDLHDTGIYGWDTLRRFVTDQSTMMAEYEAELVAKGWSREPSASPRR